MRLPSLAQIAWAVLVALVAHVDVGVDRGFDRRASANLEIDAVLLGLIDQTVANPAVGFPAGGIAGRQHDFAVVLAERDLALQHIDELVFVAMPVPLRRPRAGL